MFGRRPDGRTVMKTLDPITRLTPYIMVERSDAQVFSNQYIDSDILSAYIKQKRAEGHKVSHMAIIIAAYVRMIAEMPHLNRFVVGKKVYARNELCVSFVTVKVKSRADFLETTIKLYFDPKDTIYEVAEKVERAIADNRKMETENGTDRIANILTSIPGLLGIIVPILKGLDRIGLLPKAIIDVSPFHTSLFISNMASIRMNSIFHHLYNFGTTTVFLGVGRKEPRVKLSEKRKLTHKNVYPIGVTTDERIAPGAQYSMAFGIFERYLRHPERLEQPPESVVYDYKSEYHLKEKYK